MKRGFLALAVGMAVVFASFWPATVRAADPGALQLTTSPLPISLVAKPGETVSTELRIRNSGNETELLKVGLMKFSAYGEEGKPQLQDREPGDDYFDWVQFSETQFKAIPGEWQTVKMTIKIPKTAALGYYYAVTFSRANPGLATGPRQQTVRGGTATLVLLEAFSPNAKRELKLSEFRVEKRSYEFLPARFTVKLRNTGNIHTAPSGTIFISRGGKQIGAIDINATRGNILPQSNRIFTSQWDDGFPVYKTKEAGGAIVLKNGQPVYSLKWDASKFNRLRFGKYTAHLVAVYDNGKQDVPLEASASFWVIPWRLILLIIAIPVVPATLVYLIMRWRFKRRRNRGGRRV
ncbi:MAG TPA: hypothetical protein VLG37_03605 [Candidatus Saccharimonadales bacterium]|nr:hypothetical protein [Candidatus Saccharimonadales bacterium]